ncbi:MAG: hypothetical protein JO115_11005 [Pseudonocardiales bacterium]|nr:hypothetical protein [Pseudonocardiales bacterium]
MDDEPSSPDVGKDTDIPAHQTQTHGQAAAGTDTEDEQQLIPVTCSMHYGAPNFTNLMVTKRGNRIIFDPHVTGSCVIVLEESAATSLFDLLSRWLPMMIDLTTEGNEP